MTPRTDSAATWEHRYDRGELLPPQPGPAGTLLVEGFAAREGVLTYRTADGGMRRELVPLETLRASAAGLARAPVTLEHPREDVTPDNYASLGVGDTDGEVSVERGGFVRVRLAVRRRDAVEAIRAGKQELSPGYRVRLDMTAGTHPVYGPYDAVQVERDYNHLAIVEQARGGHEVRMRADAAYSTETVKAPGASSSTSTGGLLKPLIAQIVALMALPARYDSDDAALEGIAAEARRRADAADAATRQLAAITAERDAAKARADAAEAKVAALEAAERARADAAEKARLDGVAKKLGIDSAKHPSARSLKLAIASAQLGSEVKADSADAYLDAFVAMAEKAPEQRGDGRLAGSRAYGPVDEPSEVPPVRNDGDGQVFDYAALFRRDSKSRRAAVGGEE